LLKSRCTRCSGSFLSAGEKKGNTDARRFTRGKAKQRLTQIGEPAGGMYRRQDNRIIRIFRINRVEYFFT